MLQPASTRGFFFARLLCHIALDRRLNWSTVVAVITGRLIRSFSRPLTVLLPLMERQLEFSNWSSQLERRSRDCFRIILPLTVVVCIEPISPFSLERVPTVDS